MAARATRRIRTRRRAALVAGVVMAALAVVLHAAGALDGLERSSLDARFSLRGTQEAPADVVVVAVDARTFEATGFQWPFPRSTHARVIDRLRAAGAKVIAYDVQFSEPTTPDEDGALLESIQRAGNVVLATTEVDENGDPNVLGGNGTLQQVHALAGNSNVAPDPGGVERRIPYSVQGLPSFAIVAAGRALGHRIPPSALPGPSALNDYAGPPGTIRTVSFSDVLAGRVAPSVFRGKVVVIGAAAPSLHDVHVTPMGNRLMSGAELQANGIATALRGFPLRAPWPHGVELLLTLLMGLVIPAAGFGLLVGWACLVGVGALAAYLAAAQVAFDHGHVLPVAGPAAAVALGIVGALLAYGLTSAFERDRTREAFGRFVPHEVVSEVLAQADGARLGGVERVCTVMFCDIRGFTTYSESRSAPVVIDVLNRVLAEMTEAVLDQGGTLLSFLGDGVMALFGAPLPQEDHADRALAAFRDLAGRMERLNRWVVAEGLGEPFSIGVGLHTGPVVCGNVGSARRLAYTAIGDTANTASRVEGLTKETGHSLLFTEDTRAALTRPAPPLVELGAHHIRGRRATVTLWGLEDESRAAQARDEHPRTAGARLRA